MSKDHRDDNNVKAGQFDKMMEKYFLDPNTNLLDQYTYRVDIFECNEEYIVEALFDEKKPKKIKIKANGKQLVITAYVKTKADSDEKPTERTVPFPFSISSKKITAVFSNNILEIRISKKDAVFSSQKEIIIHC
ncbi:Hsp20/alpha crystallin family protein [Bacillus sp. V59.32b]|uniref:Hsp20/alpha crystallin family protein n=1 Tax=Bacillus sp. V59.32b TaxID=1758642 RepID=UPI000E3B9FD5|nr:Hsp20/alpha crystallin family protein [Bacillus sp. V59.32b]RFU68412.1 Hsp20/alpha crystallin family protein [Bacillus sp. V59.32b]